MTVKQLIEMFKYYTTGVEERELYDFVECEYDNVRLHDGKLFDLKHEKVLKRKVKSWCIRKVFGIERVVIKVF